MSRAHARLAWLATAALVVGLARAAEGPPAAEVGALVGEVVTERVSTNGNTSQRDLIVYLEPRKPVALKPPREPVPVVQRQISFEPHVLAVVAGTRLRFSNEDPLMHNVQSKAACCTLDKDMDKGATLEQALDKPGAIELACRIHPEMQMHVLVLDTPYFAQVRIAKEEAEGKSVYRTRYALQGIPPGEYVLKTWNKRLQPVEIPVTITAGEPTRRDLDLKK